MSSTHEGVSCDICMKSNFTGKRYKCLICYDFDLCSQCHDQSVSVLNTTTNPTAKNPTTAPASNPTATHKAYYTNNPTIPPPPPPQNNNNNNNNHSNTHPMQCILTKSDYELFYGSSLIDIAEQSAFTCPYCGSLGFSEATLCEHISSQHVNASSANGAAALQDVVCPICAVLPSSSGGDPNHLTEDLLQHINLEHSNRSGEDTLSNATSEANSLIASSFGASMPSTASAVAAAAALRFSRRLNYSQNTLRTTTSSSRNLINSNSSSSSAAANRYAFQFGSGNPGGGTTSSGLGLSSTNSLSSYIRSSSGGASLIDTNSMDPIAELLSQLTGVRRAASSSQSTNLQLQQLQAQLNRERENLQQQQQGQSSSSSRHHNTIGHHLFGGSNSTKINTFTSKNLSGQNQAGQQSNQANQTATNLTNTLTNQILELPANLFLQPLITNRDSRYLLNK